MVWWTYLQDLELVAKPIQTHIDLSVNRTVSGEHTKVERTQQPQLDGEGSKSSSVLEGGAGNVTGLQSSSQHLSNKSQESFQLQSSSFTESKVCERYVQYTYQSIV